MLWKRVNEHCEVDESTRFWPDYWTTEEEKRARFPRQANYWMASKKQRKAKVDSFNGQIEQLVARRVRAERHLSGVRQVDLAEAVGISQATLSRIETGKRQATLAEIIRIAVQLKCSVRRFFDPPPREVEVSGWERRRVIPRIWREIEEAALRGDLPEEHPIYD